MTIRDWFRSKPRRPYSYYDAPFYETPRDDGLDPEPAPPDLDLDIEVIRVRHPYLNESVPTLAGRLEAVQKERDGMAQEIRRLLDQRDTLVRMLRLSMEERDVMRARLEGTVVAPTAPA